MRDTFVPRLRPVEMIFVPDARWGKLLILRDTQRISSAIAHIPPALVAIVAQIDGKKSCKQIARELESEYGDEAQSLVLELVRQLDESLFLDSDTFARALEKAKGEFLAAQLRPAIHAGGAYHEDPEALRTYIVDHCYAPARSTALPGHACSLVSPHIDPWRGAVAYGHAYQTFAEALSSETDTFLVFGTAHAPMHEPFALLNKGFDTPLGAVPVAGDLVNELSTSARFDPFRDVLNHKGEHSIEFQAVFLRHAMAKKPIRIVPILAGLGALQARGGDPQRDARVTHFLGKIANMVAREGSRIAVIAGADLAHVGPRFGDRRAFNEDERADLAAVDGESLARSSACEPSLFWEHVAHDLDRRRVCGLAPMYALLRSIGADARGHTIDYAQNVDPDDGSIVSYAAQVFVR